MKLKHLFSALTAVTMLFTFTSCDEGSGQWQASNIVTYVGPLSGYSAVTWQEINDSEPITLLLPDMTITSTGTPLELNTRLLLNLIFDEDVTGLTNNMVITRDQINGAILEVTTLNPEYSSQIPPEGWENELQQSISAFFRSGTYINMVSSLPYGTTLGEDGMTMNFYVDSQTLNNETVEAYLSYTNPAASAGASYTLTYYNCIDISTLMTGKAKNLTVYFHNEDRSINSYYPNATTVASDYQSVTIPLQ